MAPTGYLTRRKKSWGVRGAIPTALPTGGGLGGGWPEEVSTNEVSSFWRPTDPIPTISMVWFRELAVRLTRYEQLELGQDVASEPAESVADPLDHRDGYPGDPQAARRAADHRAAKRYYERHLRDAPSVDDPLFLILWGPAGIFPKWPPRR
jgi:hypothetical protein